MRPVRKLKRIRGLHAQDVAAGCVLAVILLSALLAPYLSLADPELMDLTKECFPPSADHPFGTDSYGRDLLSRVVYGGRVSLTVGMVAVAIGAGLGTVLGVLAGYLGGWVDSVTMRLMDALMTFPPILLAIVLVGLIGPNTSNVALGLGITNIPRFARVARGSTLSLRNREFVQAARAVGASDGRIVSRHLLPNLMGPVVVQAVVAYAYSIIAEAGMSFLGLGTQPPTPSWGLMLSDARRYLTSAPWYALVPGLALTVSVVSITIVGDRLREYLDPRQRMNW